MTDPTYRPGVTTSEFWQSAAYSVVMLIVSVLLATHTIANINAEAVAQGIAQSVGIVATALSGAYVVSSYSHGRSTYKAHRDIAMANASVAEAQVQAESAPPPTVARDPSVLRPDHGYHLSALPLTVEPPDESIEWINDTATSDNPPTMILATEPPQRETWPRTSVVLPAPEETKVLERLIVPAPNDPIPSRSLSGSRSIFPATPPAP